jgi:hypothetical protein
VRAQVTTLRKVGNEQIKYTFCYSKKNAAGYPTDFKALVVEPATLEKHLTFGN